MLIADPDKARRLARAICSDIILYNGSIREAPPGDRARLLATPVREGRELYVSRVAPDLAGIFDEELAMVSERFECGPIGLDAPMPPPGAHPPLPRNERREETRPVEVMIGPPSTLMVFAMLGFVVLVAIGMWLWHAR